jgi:Na+/melibiose symporter-like transporter
MRIGASLVLIAIGAIIRFAITPQHSHGVNWGLIGVILMIVGAVGALITIAFMTTRRRTDVTYRRDGATYTDPAPLDPRV